MFLIDTVPRIFAISQASQFCVARGIDPDDPQLSEWRHGRLHADVMLNGPAESQERADSRRLAYTVAKTMRLVAFDAAEQRTNAEDPALEAYDDIITQTIHGNISVAEFEKRSSDFVFSLGLKPPASTDA